MAFTQYSIMHKKQKENEVYPDIVDFIFFNWIITYISAWKIYNPKFNLLKSLLTDN
jgi:hypothetical protein